MNKFRLLLSATAVVLLAVASSPLRNKFLPYYFLSLTRKFNRSHFLNHRSLFSFKFEVLRPISRFISLLLVILDTIAMLNVWCIFLAFHLEELFFQGEDTVDLVVTNGTIYTSNATFPFADSMGIRGGRIVRLGNYSSLQVHYHRLSPICFFWSLTLHLS